MAANLITSATNPLLKDIRRAQERGGLTPQGWMIAEGPRLVEEVAKSGRTVARLIIREGAAVPEGMPVEQVVEVSGRLFESISGTETPQGILALLDPPQYELTDVVTEGALLVILDGLQDPGNAGTIVRSAEAFGATGVIFLDGSVSPLSPKVIRASAGSLLRVPFVRLNRDQLRLEMPIFAGVSDVGKAPWECNFRVACALVVGNEGRGVQPELLGKSRPVRIPTGGVDSLNAAVAASVLLYEAARQRAVPGGQ